MSGCAGCTNKPFSADFQLRYRAVQRDRNERITDWALEQLDRLAGTHARDRLFTVARSWADLRMIDRLRQLSQK